VAVRAAAAGQLLFQGLHQVREIKVQVTQMIRVEQGPVLAVFGVRQQVGQMHGPRQPLGGGGQGRHRVQAQQGQVSEVILAQGAVVQMGVDEAQAFETAPGTPLPGELRNEEALALASPTMTWVTAPDRFTRIPTWRFTSREISASCRANSGVTSSRGGILRR